MNNLIDQVGQLAAWKRYKIFNTEKASEFENIMWELKRLDNFGSGPY